MRWPRLGHCARGAAFVFLWAGVAAAQDEAVEEPKESPVQAHGHVSLEGGLGVAETKLQSLQLESLLQFDAPLSDSTNFTGILRLRSDPFFDYGYLDGRDFPELSLATSPVRFGEEAELELREAYIRTQAGKWNLTLGKQQIVWGVADGLKVLDVVNPQDLREFILDDFEDSRIPLLAVNAERPIKDWTLQLIWIPDTSYHVIPRQDSEFEITSGVPSPPRGFELEIEEPDKPGRFITDSDVGLQLSTFKGGWDITFNYLYHYDDIPAFPRSYRLSEDGQEVIAHPEYKRLHLIGGSFSKAFGGLTVRAEYGLFLDKYYSTGNYFDLDGVVRGDSVSYVLGFDWFAFNNTFMSVQVFQDWFSNDAEGLERDQVQTYITCFAQHRFLHDTLTVEGMWLFDVNHGDGLIRPKITYAVNDELNVYAGVDYFYGSDKGLFGQFDKKDRVIFGVEWSF
ncbi:MAG: hypothetical protein IT365_12990 [Candidatus Hydrogenedentes bacterium]|nr:hypothetical protein [Candidatus Hydrogenedentota bacterium]